jgi:hypothetical protein
MLFDSVATRIDQLVLYSMHRRMPESFSQINQDEPSFEEVLAGTHVDHRLTPAYNVYAPGERPVVLRSMGEQIECVVNVKLHPDPAAPLLIYHHGFSETPYDSSWRRIFRGRSPIPLSTVCIRAPFHSHWREPFREAFSSIGRVYQTFAGSLRVIELVQRQFESEGAAFTTLAGVSWGGITSMLYGGQFGGVRALAPMLSSPNLAQVVWDAAEMVGTEIPISRGELDELLDFTPRCEFDPGRVFPLMGDTDAFFRLDKHASIYSSKPVIVHRAHVFSLYGVRPLRNHLFQVMEWAGAHP